MLYRLINKVIFIGTMFLLTFSQVNSFSWEINTQNSYLISNKIEVIKKVDLVITGYYSPLPNQKKYVTGSYEKEIALNGDWVWMASWKKVFIWAIAAPKKYDFWTKIYIEWYWVWVVEDRWWKVIDDNHTKIDIWMWYGDEWLQRAINWWSKKTTWYIVSSDTDTNFSFWEPIITDINYNTTEKLTLTPESNNTFLLKEINKELVVEITHNDSGHKVIICLQTEWFSLANDIAYPFFMDSNTVSFLVRQDRPDAVRGIDIKSDIESLFKHNTDYFAYVTTYNSEWNPREEQVYRVQVSLTPIIIQDLATSLRNIQEALDEIDNDTDM